MTQLSIQVKGAELVRKGLQDLSAEIPKIGRLQIYNTAQAVVRRMKIYPPAPPMSTYVRTGRLGGNYTITPKSNGYTIANNTSYSKYVVGNAQGLEQAWMHQGRWQKFRDVYGEEVNKLPDEIVNHIYRFTRDAGLGPTIKPSQGRCL
jgi:hypothetical protein